MVAAMNLSAAIGHSFAPSHELQPVLHTISIPGSMHLMNIRLHKFNQALREGNPRSDGLASAGGAPGAAPCFSQELVENDTAYSSAICSAILRNRAPPFR